MEKVKWYASAQPIWIGLPLPESENELSWSVPWRWQAKSASALVKTRNGKCCTLKIFRDGEHVNPLRLWGWLLYSSQRWPDRPVHTQMGKNVIVIIENTQTRHYTYNQARQSANVHPSFHYPCEKVFSQSSLILNITVEESWIIPQTAREKSFAIRLAVFYL